MLSCVCKAETKQNRISRIEVLHSASETDSETRFGKIARQHLSRDQVIGATTATILLIRGESYV